MQLTPLWPNYFFKIHFNIVLPPTQKCCYWSLAIRFLNPTQACHIQCCAHLMLEYSNLKFCMKPVAHDFNIVWTVYSVKHTKTFINQLHAHLFIKGCDTFRPSTRPSLGEHSCVGASCVQNLQEYVTDTPQFWTDMTHQHNNHTTWRWPDVRPKHVGALLFICTCSRFMNIFVCSKWEEKFSVRKKKSTRFDYTAKYLKIGHDLVHHLMAHNQTIW
jgi:hypothetical protein